MSSNLPPGVTVGMIDRAMGHNSPLEAAEEWAMEELAKQCKTPFEYKIAVLAGIAAMQATREPLAEQVKEGIDNFKADMAELGECPTCQAGISAIGERIHLSGCPEVQRNLPTGTIFPNM